MNKVVSNSECMVLFCTYNILNIDIFKKHPTVQFISLFSEAACRGRCCSTLTIYDVVMNLRHKVKRHHAALPSSDVLRENQLVDIFERFLHSLHILCGGFLIK